MQKKGRRLSSCDLLIGSCQFRSKQWHHQQRYDVNDLDQRIDRRASRIFVRFANGIAGYCRFVSVKALAAAIAVFDVLLGVIPCITTCGHGVSDKQAGYDRAEAKAAKRLRPGLKRSLYLRWTAALQSKKSPAHGRAFFGSEGRRSYMNFSRMPPYCTKNGTKTSDRMADNLIRIFSDGPDVSFRGSPTVSPTTAAL